jgi:hypothetical protein
MTDKQLFAEIKIGMSRVDVENVLGKPVLEVGNEVHYGKTPRINKWQSPASPTSISIVYSAQKVVETRQYYGADE